MVRVVGRPGPGQQVSGQHASSQHGSRPNTSGGNHGSDTRGVLYVHSCSGALCPHIEWAVASVMGSRVRLDWSRQPAEPGALRAELSWVGPPGTASRLASAMRAFTGVRLEVTEDPTPMHAGSLGSPPVAAHQGERISYSPSLGIFRAEMGAHGEILISESRLRAAHTAAAHGVVDLADAVARLWGEPWDVELEPFRSAAEFAGDLHEVI